MRREMAGGILLGLLLSAGIGYAAVGDMKADFYVATDGNDVNAGTARKPFATVARARDAVRELKKDGLKKDIVVRIRDGTYRLKEPLVFGPEDSGTEKFSIAYAAAPDEKPVFSGGRLITGWKKGAGELWTVELPEVKAGKPALRSLGEGGWYFRQLFVNGRRAVRARSPNDGFFRVVKAGPDNRTGFTFKPGDLRAFKNLDDAEILFLHDWCTSRVRVKTVDETTNTVTLADPIGCSGADFYAITGFESNPRYAVENAPELLDSPGEWYLDRKTGVLSYWPLDGEDLAKAEVVAPVLNVLLSVKGEAGQARRVENLRLIGLTFSHAEFPLPDHGYAEGQAGFYEIRPNKDRNWTRARNPAAVVLENTTGCALEACEVSGVGGSGISLQGACETNRVTGCHVHDIGGNGIMVGETENRPKLLARDNTIANNYVHHCARIAHGCVGIWVGLTEGTVIAHNEICDLPYTGISIGWQWNPDPTQCKGNVIESNHIHRVMQMLSDGGGIYTLGRQPGTILRGNHIHDIPPNAGRAESNGMFLDEGSSAFTVEDNTIHGVAKSAIRFHKAVGLTVRGNALFNSPGVGPFTFNTCEGKEMTFEGNDVAAMPRLSAREAGKVGRALACNGISTYEEVAHSPELEPEQLTMEAWVRLREYPAGDDARRWIVNKNGNEWQEGHYALCVSGANAGAYLNIGGGKENCFGVWSTNAPIKLDTWHHLAATYDGKDLRLYVDGAPAGSAAVNKARRLGASPLAIGRRQDGFAPFHFKGLIDEVRICRKALSADDIAEDIRKPGKVAVPDTLAGRWSFDDDPQKLPETGASQAGLEPAHRARLLGK